MEITKQRFALMRDCDRQTKQTQYYFIIEAERIGKYLCPKIPIDEATFWKLKQFYHIHYEGEYNNSFEPNIERTKFETYENATEDMINPFAKEEYRRGKLSNTNWEAI